MDTKGTQNAQMQGPKTPAPELGEWPWILMAEGDSHPQGYDRT
jgi:hypothetical protein